MFAGSSVRRQVLSTGCHRTLGVLLCPAQERCEVASQPSQTRSTLPPPGRRQTMQQSSSTAGTAASTVSVGPLAASGSVGPLAAKVAKL